MINVNGEVVGINSAIFSQSGGNVGIGFAIPVDLAKKVVEQLRKNGRVVRGWLGIRAQELAPQQAASLGLAKHAGGLAAVSEVADHGPAAEVGIKTGDIILEFNGRPLPKSQDLPSLVADTAPGQKISLKILREKTERTVTVKVGELSDEVEIILPAEARDPELGIRVQKITPEMARRHALGSTKGVMVIEVQPGAPADLAGLELGDVIREVNQRPDNAVKDFEKALRHSRKGDRILLLVHRGDNAVYFSVKRKG